MSSGLKQENAQLCGEIVALRARLAEAQQARNNYQAAHAIEAQKVDTANDLLRRALKALRPEWEPLRAAISAHLNPLKEGQ